MRCDTTQLIPTDNDWVEEGKSLVLEMDPEDAVEFIRDCFSSDCDELVESVTSLIKATKHEKASLSKRMKLQKKAVESVFDAASKIWSMCQIFDTFAAQMASGSYRNSRKRWREEDDEILIDLVCEGKSDVFISNCLGRSVSACKSRVTYLVGIEKMSEKTAGYFIGMLSGEEVSGSIEGLVYKQEPKEL